MNAPAEPPVIPPPRFPWLAIAIALFAGAAGWEMACRLGGRTEAWDSPAYWQIAYPAFGVTVLVLAYLWPRSGWCTWAALAVGQALTMFVKNPGGSLLPLGVMVMLVMCAPLIIAGRLGARVRAWRKAK
jgi:hypothetical protein